ncbi:MAG: crossover junction endodeoxyribonuclease RuvC [Candidatus Levyibacteriota bacterium]|jgi:crossover junction endodeoxyribonuclease RuvC
MRILGIDPGIGRCGWGVLEYRNSKLEVRGFGCIETSPKKNVQDRLKQIHEEISNIIKQYKPEVLSIEELFFNTNAKTAFVVGQARGVILLAAAQNNLEIAIYTPLQVKLALTGYGRAEKPQVGQMVKTLLSLKEVPKPDDTADGLAIAIAHAFSAKNAKY